MAIEQFGGIEALRAIELPRPRPRSGEVLIRIVAAGVNPHDARLCAGQLDPGASFPLVPGCDAAGVVEELGPGATSVRKGDRVWACTKSSAAQRGCFAEYVAVPETSVALMPPRLLFEEAAAVPLAAVAARHGVGAAAAGTTLVILGAAGGVGHFAIQLAKLAGARVIACAGPSSQSFVLGLGADAGIDHTREELGAALARLAPEGVGAVLDTVGGDALARSIELVQPGGTLVSLVEAPDAAAAARRGIDARSITVEPGGAELREIARAFQEKKLRVAVHKIVPLAQAAEALRLLDSGQVQGKLVLAL